MPKNNFFKSKKQNLMKKKTAFNLNLVSELCTPYTEAELGRYSRQILLPTFGIDRQAALARARVLVVGKEREGVFILFYFLFVGFLLHLATT